MQKKKAIEEPYLKITEKNEKSKEDERKQVGK